jgi:23S rRNA pseudouridine1911/1915/1917 synthase
LINSGEVLVNDKHEKPSFLVHAGMKVTVLSEPEPEIQNLEPAEMDLDIVYEDEFLMVINKPRGLAVHPAVTLKEPSLVNVLLSTNVQLSSAAGEFRPGIVHRLDKDTTGVILIAKNDIVHANLAKQIEEKTAERRYFAVVAGDLSQERFTIQAPIGRDERYRVRMTVTQKGKPAVTHIKQIARVEAGTLIAARLETGRTHQIRVHLRATGHPVVGDKLYAPREFQSLPMQLHAAFISFDHPVSNERIGFYANPPEDFVGHMIVDRNMIDPF